MWCGGTRRGGQGQPGRGMKEGAPLGLCRGLDLVGKAVLKATARAIEAETERGEGAAQRQTRF